MFVYWNTFSAPAAVAGGMLIGIASAMFALLNGRIAGVSGIIGGLLNPGLVALGMGQAKALVFVAVMLVVMGLFERLERRSLNTLPRTPRPIRPA